MMEIWTSSVREELLATLKLIAGLLAWHNGIIWFAWLLFILASLDTLLAIRFALLEIALMRAAKKQNAKGGVEK